MYACGFPFGIKIYCEGVVIVGFDNIVCNGNEYCPAKTAGLKQGDIIKRINNEKILSNEDLIEVINKNKDNEITLDIVRNDKEITLKTRAIKTSSDNYKLGVWIKDSTAGIGTMTFYDKESNSFAALGHGVCENETSKLLPISKGSPMYAQINRINKSSKGLTGCLKGEFLSEMKGSIIDNTEIGVYGKAEINAQNLKAYEIACKDEVDIGDAQILTTIDGTSPKLYDIKIDCYNISKSSKSKALVIRITDEELIEKTGGIVQGMSGSPIIQNDKIVGAVTHVFVNEPEKGYAIYAEDMLLQMQSSCNIF